MKTKIEKNFDAVQFMREQQQKLSEKSSRMTKEEVVEYFKRKQLESNVKPSAWRNTRLSYQSSFDFNFIAQRLH